MCIVYTQRPEPKTLVCKRKASLWFQQRTIMEQRSGGRVWCDTISPRPSFSSGDCGGRKLRQSHYPLQQSRLTTVMTKGDEELEVEEQQFESSDEQDDIDVVELRREDEEDADVILTGCHFKYNVSLITFRTYFDGK